MCIYLFFKLALSPAASGNTDPEKPSQTHLLRTNGLKYTFLNKLTRSSLSLVTALPRVATLTLTAAPSLAPSSPSSGVISHQAHMHFFVSPLRITSSQNKPQVKFSILIPRLKGTAPLLSPQILTWNQAVALRRKSFWRSWMKE